MLRNSPNKLALDIVDCWNFVQKFHSFPVSASAFDLNTAFILETLFLILRHIFASLDHLMLKYQYFFPRTHLKAWEAQSMGNRCLSGRCFPGFQVFSMGLMVPSSDNSGKILNARTYTILLRWIWWYTKPCLQGRNSHYSLQCDCSLIDKVGCWEAIYDLGFCFPPA